MLKVMLKIKQSIDLSIYRGTTRSLDNKERFKVLFPYWHACMPASRRATTAIRKHRYYVCSIYLIAYTFERT